MRAGKSGSKAGLRQAASAADIRLAVHYIFVHGLSGWGSYDKLYKRVPYWGMLGGDLMKYLRKQGFDSYAASVSPEGSAWDRACELYAQLAGKVVDYGKAHSERCGHPRFGRDFSHEPLIPDWDQGCQIVLLGHSFGGTTVRLLSELLVNGSDEERAATSSDDLSELFKGGHKGRIRAIVTLASPINGTTAYDMYEDRSFDIASVPISDKDLKSAKMFDNRRKSAPDSRVLSDYAAYDMYIDNAIELNRRISTFPDVYYLSVPCSATVADAEGYHEPVRKKMESMFCKTSILMGHYTGTTTGGFEIGEDWRENDGLVNTVSAIAPIGEPTVPFSADSARPGIWNILPTYHKDHMSLQGGIIRHNRIRPFYLELVTAISNLK